MQKLLLILMLVSVSVIIEAAPPTAKSAKAPSDASQSLGSVDQQDTTDIFAIPLDTSEEEEKQEEDKLMSIQKKRQEKRAAQNSSSSNGAKG